MSISLLLLLPVYLPLAWIDWHLFRHHYGGTDLLRQLLVVAVTACTVVIVHQQMQDMPGIWPAVLPPLAAYVVLLLAWLLALLWRRQRLA